MDKIRQGFLTYNSSQSENFSGITTLFFSFFFCKIFWLWNFCWKAKERTYLGVWMYSHKSKKTFRSIKNSTQVIQPNQHKTYLGKPHPKSVKFCGLKIIAGCGSP